MARILDARAVITATDATGQTFGQVAEKIRKISAAAKGVDGVGGRLAAVNQKVEQFGKHTTAVGRRMTWGFTVPSALVGRSLYQNLRAFELASNKLKAFGDLNEEELKRARDLAVQLGQKYSFGPTGVIEGMVEEIKAGFEPRHLEAIQKPLLDFATLAEIDVPQAAELAIFSLAGFGRMYDATGRLLDDGPLQKNLREMVDIFAVLNKVAPGSIRDISHTFKYSAAIAKNLKVAPEQLGAFTAALAQAGIIGPEAGVALRSMMVRFLKTPRPALAALNAAGLTLEDYVIKNPAALTPAMLLNAVENQSGKMSPKRRAAMLSRFERLAGLTGDDYEKGLIGAIRTGGGDLRDAEVAGKLVTRIMGTAVERIDIIGFLRDVFTKTANPGAVMATFMDARQGSRLANLDSARVATMLRGLEAELLAARSRGSSLSVEMAEKINSGLIESENKLRGSFQRLIQTAGEAGVTEGLVNVMDSLSNGLKALAEVDPKIIELTTNALALGAALGPVVYIFGKLSKGAGAIGRGLAWFVPGGTVATIAAATGNPAVAGALATGATVPVSVAGVLAAEGGKQVFDQREMFRRQLATINKPPAERAADLASIQEALKGSVDVNVKVQVDPSPDFITRVTSQVGNFFGRIFGGSSAAADGTTGSTGSAMPEAKP